MADFVGFRTAQSRTRGKDFVRRVAGGNAARRAARIAIGTRAQGREDRHGPSSRSTTRPATRRSRRAAGTPRSRCRPGRATSPSSGATRSSSRDAARIKSLAREQKQPLMLGYFQPDVDLKNPEAPKGSYWVMWDPGRVKQSGKEKLAAARRPHPPVDREPGQHLRGPQRQPGPRAEVDRGDEVHGREGRERPLGPHDLPGPRPQGSAVHHRAPPRDRPGRAEGVHVQVEDLGAVRLPRRRACRASRRTVALPGL